MAGDLTSRAGCHDDQSCWIPAAGWLLWSGVGGGLACLSATQSSAPQTEGGSSSDDKGEGRAAKDMVHGIKSFVDTVSSHEGAELPW